MRQHKKNKVSQRSVSVAIIMGSKNDWPVMKAAAQALEDFQISYTTQVVSAHRTPDLMVEFSKHAAENDLKIIIAGAGGAAHLPGMVASLTHLPVIGVPVTVGSLGGLDALLSIAQMPKGVPVACVAVDNAYNAGLLAVRMLAIGESNIGTGNISAKTAQKIPAKLTDKLKKHQLALKKKILRQRVG